MEVYKPATIIINGVEKDTAQIAFPFLLHILVVFISFFPNQLIEKFTSYFQ